MTEGGKEWWGGWGDLKLDAARGAHDTINPIRGFVIYFNNSMS